MVQMVKSSIQPTTKKNELFFQTSIQGDLTMLSTYIKETIKD